MLTDLAACVAAVAQGHYWVGRQPVQSLVQVLQELTQQVNKPAEKTFDLTMRDLGLVAMVVQGLTNKDIGQECGVTEETGKHHLKSIFDKVGVSSRLELAVFAINHQLVGELGAAHQPRPA